MGAIATHPDLLTKLAQPHRRGVDKPYNVTGHDPNGYGSYWLLAGGRWEAGTTPATAAGEALSNTSPGAMPLPAVPGGEELYLASLAATANASGTLTNAGLMFYDRLVQTGTLSGVLTTTQAVGSAALPRETSGEGVQMYMEIYTSVGTTAATATVTYVNQAGVTKTTTVTFGGTSGRSSPTMLRVPLAEGDTGVRSVTDVTLSVSTGTPGAWGFTLAKPLFLVPVFATSDTVMDWADLGLPKIPADACVALMHHQTGSRPALHCELGFVTA